MATGRPAPAPAAPGRLGEAIPAAQVRAYLEALTRWRGERRTELDRIDAAAMAAEDSASYTADVMLALSLWQAADERLGRLTALWDSGRADARAREEMSRILHGRLGGGPGAAPGALGLSLAEATRLCDTVTAALRARLAFDPLAADVAARIAAVRAGLHRVEDLVRQRARDGNDGDGLPDAARVDEMRRRLEDLASRAGAGADVSGPFAVLEAEAARAERDLIVAAGRRRDLGRDRAAAQELLAELERREAQVRELAGRCAGLIAAPPRLAVPDPSALGPVPAQRQALDEYRARLERVAAALDVARRAYAAPLTERDDLRGLLLALGAKADATGRAGDPAVEAAFTAARTALWSEPCDVDTARHLVAEYQRLSSARPAARPGPTEGS